MKGFGGALCVIAMCFAITAQATPPRVTVLEQEIIGVNETHAYTRLSLSDNSGTYYVKRVDEYVTKIDIQTSLVVSQIPLRSTVTDTVDGYPGVLHERPIEGGVAVDEYLISETASPSLRRSHEPIGYKIKNGALITNFNDPTGASGAKTLKNEAELLDIVFSQINSIYARYEVLTEEQSADLSGKYLLTHPIEDISGCKVVEQFTSIWDNGNEADTQTSLLPLRIDCDYDDETQYVSFFVFVPDWQNLNR